MSRTLADIKAEIIHTYISKYAGLYTHSEILEMVNTAALDIYKSQIPIKESTTDKKELLQENYG